MSALISVCSVTYRNLEATRNFVESVYANTFDDFEFIMVDNNSPDDVANYLRSVSEKRNNFIWVRNKANWGIGVGMNQAMRRATTDWLFRTDADIVINTSYWTKLMREMVLAYPEIGGLGTAITGGVQCNNGRYIETDLICSCCMLISYDAIRAIRRKIRSEELNILGRLYPHFNLPERFPYHYRFLEGIKQWTLRADGFWDCGWKNYGMDDFDFSYQLLWVGAHLAKDPRINVTHIDDSMRPDNDLTRNKDVQEGAQYLRTKWEIVEDHWDDPEAPNGKGWKDVWGYLPAHRRYYERIGYKR